MISKEEIINKLKELNKNNLYIFGSGSTNNHEDTGSMYLVSPTFGLIMVGNPQNILVSKKEFDIKDFIKKSSAEGYGLHSIDSEGIAMAKETDIPGFVSYRSLYRKFDDKEEERILRIMRKKMTLKEKINYSLRKKSEDTGYYDAPCNDPYMLKDYLSGGIALDLHCAISDKKTGLNYQD